jgi:hypothetical protein
MAGKEIANANLTLAPDPPISGGTGTVSTSPSTKVKAGGAGVHRGTINFTWAGGTYAGQPIVSGSGSITATAVKAKADGQAVVRKDDSGPISGTYTNPAPPPPTLPFSGTVKVSNAGQTKDRGQ